MIKKQIEKLLERKSLNADESFDAASAMIQDADPVQIAALLALLRVKGETADELVGFVNAMRLHAKSFRFDRPVLDIVGTGGDQGGTVNISTGSALLAASCGIPIVKHGNRAVSSLCGSADVLEAMGYNIHLSPHELQESLRKTGFGFCFAPDYHPAMKQVRPIRKGLGIPTLFNLIGPLLNPAGIDHMQIGVYKPEFVQLIAETLFRLGTKRSLVFHSYGLDELTCLGPTDAILVTEKGLESFHVDPEKLGLKKCTREDLKGGDAQTNAQILKGALSGIPSPISDTLILNAGAALFLYGSAINLQEGIQMAKKQLFRKKSLKNAIQKNKNAVLAEIKRASPSKGKIGRIDNVAERALLYADAGATAISVLTSSLFEGTLEDLRNVSAALKETDLPVLRKDFLMKKEQIAEAAEYGADIVLLIVTFLGKKTKEMLLEAHRLGLEAIVEVHDEAELRIALDAGAEIIGVNQRNLKAFITVDDEGKVTSLERRDLKDFTMHPEIYEKLIGQIPPHIVKIAESGVKTADDAEKSFRIGYDAVLVGESLTRAEDPAQFLSSLRNCYVG